MPAIKIDAGGMQEFEVRDKVFTVDVFHFLMRMGEIWDEGHETREYWDHVNVLVQECGGPACTKAELMQITSHISAIGEDLKKKLGPEPSSQNATDSTASD